jgi:hypothetical protein
VVLLSACAGATSLLAADHARAAQLFYDGFNYTVGERLGGSGTSPIGQTAPNGEQWIVRSPASGGSYNPANDTLVIDGNLGYLGLAPGSGSASVRYGSSVANGGAGKYVNAVQLPSGASVTGGSLYYSAIVRFNGTQPPDPAAAVAPGGVRHSYMSFSTDTANPATDAGIGVSTAGGGGGIPLPAAAWLRDSGTTDFHFGSGKQNSDGLGTTASAPSWQSGTVSFPNQQGNITGTGQDEATIADDVWLVVLKYTFLDGALNNDTVSMWINPVANTLGDNAGEAVAGAAGGSYYSAINATVTANIDAAQIRSFMLLGVGQTVNPSKTIDTTVDDVRIGETWADVTTAALTWDGDGVVGAGPADASGAWETSNNWWNGANRDWGSSYSALFGSGGGGTGDVAVTLASPQIAGKLVFVNNSPTYAISGSAITLNGADGEGIVAHQSATVSSDITLAANQSWYVASGATFTAGNVAGAGTLRKTGAGEAVVNHVRSAGVTVSEGTLRVAPSAQPAAVSNVGTLGIAANARLDLGDNKLVTETPVGTFDGTAYSGVQGEVARAYNFGAWDQPGLMTSEELAGPNAGPLSGTTTIGVATGEQILFLAPTDTGAFAGQTITGATTIAMYTYAGDMNFDGLVDAADYGVIDNWVQFPGSDGYANGDLNYDGVIDAADYGIIDNTIQLQGDPIPGWDSSASPAAAVTAVPEPAGAMSMLMFAGAAAISRRRRRRLRQRRE